MHTHTHIHTHEVYLMNKKDNGGGERKDLAFN